MNERLVAEERLGLGLMSVFGQGKTFARELWTVARWKNGEIVEENLFYDQVGFLRQIGVFNPAPPFPGAVKLSVAASFRRPAAQARRRWAGASRAGGPRSGARSRGARLRS